MPTRLEGTSLLNFARFDDGDGGVFPLSEKDRKKLRKMGVRVGTGKNPGFVHLGLPEGITYEFNKNGQITTRRTAGQGGEHFKTCVSDLRPDETITIRKSGLFSSEVVLKGENKE
jgi:hypothetical protein